MKKIINPIMKKSHRGGFYNVFVSITFVNGRLSISGVEGPMSNGNAIGSCGQIDMHLRTEDRSEWKYVSDWDSEKVTKLLEIWDQWHLNDMKAGTPKQEAFVREWKKSNKYDYTEVCKALESASLLYDGDYKYGSAWLTEEVPSDTIEWLFSLPGTEVTPAWV